MKKALRSQQNWLCLILVIIVLACIISGCNSSSLTLFSTKTPTITLTQTPTNTLIPSATPKPTKTITPVRTPTLIPTLVPGSFRNPLHTGDTVSIQPFPPEFLKEGMEPIVVMECTLLDVKRGKEALEIVKQSHEYSVINPLVEGQEFLAVKVKLRQTEYIEPNTPQTLYPWWNLAIRYEENGKNYISENLLTLWAEGYVPVEGEGWVTFRIKEGSNPYLFFSPFIMIYEEAYKNNDINPLGAYYQLFNE